MRSKNAHDRNARDAALDEEIRAHLEMAIADRVARGEPYELAVAAARREFGNIGHVKELTHEAWGGVWLERLRQDLSFTLRSLRRSPGFTIVALVVLALGIGLNTAMFSIVNAILLRPLPFRDPGELYAISRAPEPGIFVREPAMLEETYLRYRTSTRAFESTSSFNVFPGTVIGAGEPVRLPIAGVTEGFFHVLGVAPLLGRSFSPDEERTGSDRVVVISHALWKDRFDGSRDALGRTVMIDGRRRTIIGIMPASFDFPSGVRAWFPIVIELDPHRIALHPVIGRLARGVAPQPALAELDAFVTALERATPHVFMKGAMSQIIPLKQRLVGDVSQSLLVFAGAVGLVLLIACANVANLMLMRATTRRHEVAIRAALGASRPRLVRQLLTESLTIAVFGGVLGIIVGGISLRLLLASAPRDLLPRTHEVRLDGAAMLVAIALALIAGALSGVLPALRATSALATTLGESRRTTTASHSTLRSAIVVVELALALMLLVGAGLMTRTFLRLRSVDLGFHANDVAALTVDLPDDRYRTAASMHAFQERMEAELSKVPGVRRIATVNWRPLSATYISGDFSLEDGRKLPPNYMVLKPCVTPSYFTVMGIAIRQGRGFDAGDNARSPRVVVVSRSVAERFWPSGDAIGKRIAMVDVPKESDWMIVVGIVDDITQDGVTSAKGPAVYQALAQVDQTFFINHLTFALLADGDPTRLLGDMRRALHTVDAVLPVEALGTMGSLVRETIAGPVFQTRLLTVFSILAVVLAAVGIYGVLAYTVTERSQEIGVRIALGATAGAVQAMVLRRTALLIACGVALGLVGAAGVTKALTRFLFQVTPTDPVTFAAVSGLLVLVALIAAYQPARRASHVDPLTAIRHS